MHDRLVAALAGLAAGGGHYQKVRDLPRNTPAKRSFYPEHTRKRMVEGLNKHMADQGVDPNAVGYIPMSPPSTEAELGIALQAPQVYAQHLPRGAKPPGFPEGFDDKAVAMANPNADRIYTAKALGGAVASETSLGKLLDKGNASLGAAIQAHPMLAKALLASTAIAPAVYSGLTPGDDDTGESLLMATLPTAALPLARETLATYHGQRIMDKSGLRTTLGQRGKMAGNLLSYMAVPVLAGAGGNMVGNIFDEDV